MTTRPAQVRVGLLGLGNVGGGVAEILARHKKLIAERAGVELRLVRALVRRPRRARSGAASRVPLTGRAAEVIEASDIDIVVELMGGMEPARRLVLRALSAGKPVVTANKAILAEHGGAIFAAALAHGTDVYFEAAVAGGVPIIRTLREAMASDRIIALAGILNGTTNYMLEAMRAGAPYEEALREAQRLGFAEANPALDVSGRDAADKLAILVRLAFGTALKPAAIPTEGIEALSPEMMRDAAALGFRVKLLALAERTGSGGGERLDVRVHPTLVPEGHVLSTVPGAQNAVSVTSDALGVSLCQGAGAGSLPTGSAVVADIIEAARNLRVRLRRRIGLETERGAPRLLAPAHAVTPHYVRLLVADRPGVLASVAKILAQHKISLATVRQEEHGARPGRPVPVVLTTHPAACGAMLAALGAMRRLPAVRGEVRTLRVLNR